MKNRLVAIVLTVILVLNNGAALAHPTHSSAVPEVHTVHFGVMEGDEQLLPLERQSTSLIGQGGDLSMPRAKSIPVSKACIIRIVPWYLPAGEIPVSACRR